MEMSKRAEKALSGSIKKWEKIISGKGSDNGTQNCNLCRLYHENDCESCPVKEYTGHSCCFGTPYDDWCELLYGYSLPIEIEDIDTVDLKRKATSIAKKELKFLKSLLPKPKQKKETKCKK